MALLALIFKLVLFIEFKSEFRFKCINESLVLQKELLINPANSFEKATALQERLKNINSARTSSLKHNTAYTVILTDYPKYESVNANNTHQNLVYQLKYSWVPNLNLSYLACGIKAVKKEGLWHYEIVYITSMDKY